MPMKKTVIALTLVMLFIFTVSTGMVMAQETVAAPPPKAPKAEPMTPEQMDAFQMMMLEHRQKVAPLQDQMWAKRMEYDALVASPNTKPADVKAVIDDMVKLRVQLRAERTEFHNQAKVKGFKPGMMRGMGFGHGGFGPDGDGFGCGFGPGRGHQRGQGMDGMKGHHGGPDRD